MSAARTPRGPGAKRRALGHPAAPARKARPASASPAAAAPELLGGRRRRGLPGSRAPAAPALHGVYPEEAAGTAAAALLQGEVRGGPGEGVGLGFQGRDAGRSAEGRKPAPGVAEGNQAQSRGAGSACRAGPGTTGRASGRGPQPGKGGRAEGPGDRAQRGGAGRQPGVRLSSPGRPAWPGPRSAEPLARVSRRAPRPPTLPWPPSPTPEPAPGAAPLARLPGPDGANTGGGGS